MKPRRLVLLFDGTWNKREDTTNVWRFRTMLRHNLDQHVYYDEGVGTAKGEKVVGGAFGRGLSRKVLQGYLWLMEQYEDESESESGIADEIFIFGFSRGAFTARSLVGVLSISGLLHRDAATHVRDAFELSRTEGVDEGHRVAKTFRSAFSRVVRIKMLGVWDTVGALGFPEVELFPRVVRDGAKENAEHKVLELPSIVQHARHALAIDEKRMIFRPTLWPSCSPGQTLEQRWFAGAHANVGGGYERDALFLRPLQWMQCESSALGLMFRSLVRPLGDAFYSCTPRNPLDETLYGVYYFTQKMRDYVRPLFSEAGARESLDYTVLERWIWSPTYSPPQLQHLLGRKPLHRPKTSALEDTEIRDIIEISHKLSQTRGYEF